MGFLSVFGDSDCSNDTENDSNPLAPCRTPAMTFVFVYLLMTAPMAVVFTLSLVVGRCLRLRDGGRSPSSDDPGFIQQLGAYIGVSLLWPVLMTLYILGVSANLVVVCFCRNWPSSETRNENWTDIRPRFMRERSKGSTATAPTNHHDDRVLDELEASIIGGGHSEWQRRGWLIMLRARNRRRMALDVDTSTGGERSGSWFEVAKMQLYAPFMEKKDRTRLMHLRKNVDDNRRSGGDGRLVVVETTSNNTVVADSVRSAESASVRVRGGGGGASVEAHGRLRELVIGVVRLQEEALFREIVRFL